jgi:hypothetical protein
MAAKLGTEADRISRSLAGGLRGLGWKSTPQVKPSSPAELARRCWREKWLEPAHVRYVDALLVDAASGKLAEQGYNGLIVSEPPRHGKSTHLSHWFPAWYLGSFPSRQVILTSYEADFASSWGRKVRDTLQEHGKREFGVQVRSDSASASRWELTTGGSMVTAGAGGSITGRGAHLLVIDDPVKNVEEAASPTIRNSVWEWYLTTVRTRLEPGGFQVVIMTRWHPDDLVGRLLRQQSENKSGDKFLVVRLPALAEGDDVLGRQAGEALWPERYPTVILEGIKETVGQRVWSALYQQDPVDAPPGTPVYETMTEAGEDKLIVRPQTFDPHLKVFRGWDFGYRVPVCIAAQIKPVLNDRGQQTGERLHVLAELSLPNTIVDEFGTWAKAQCDMLFPTAQFVDYGDQAGHQKSDKSNLTSIEILRTKGINIITAACGVEAGINLLQGLIASQRVEFDPHCKTLLAALREGYVRDNRGEPVGGVDGHPWADHADALRYLCHHAFRFSSDKTDGQQAIIPPPMPSRSQPAPKHEPANADQPRAVRVMPSPHRDLTKPYQTATVYRPALQWTRR